MTHREALGLVEVEHFFTIKNIEIFDLHRQKIRKNLRRMNKWRVQSSKPEIVHRKVGAKRPKNHAKEH